VRIATCHRLLSSICVCAATLWGQTLAPVVERTLTQASAPTGTTAPDSGLSAQEVNDRFVREWSKRIEGREDEPAARVFKNIRLDWLKSTPAGQFLSIMDGGYAKALGVRCTHCHADEDFASDDKRAKRAAREMATMHWGINQRLARMQNLRSSADERAINCATCHRGAIDPHESQR
jgi:Photosynthetic reaction centre cytochrome C subunit